MAKSPKQVSRIGIAFASEVRVQILMRLRKKGELTCAEATSGMGRSQPAMSQHIKVLRREGLILARPGSRTRSVLLSINPAMLNLLNAIAA